MLYYVLDKPNSRPVSLHIPPSSDNAQARLPAPFRSSRLSSSQWGDQEFFSPMQLSADYHNSVHQVLKGCHLQ